MPPFISILITLFIISIALKIALKVTGCLMRLIILIVALWLIVMALNLGFGFLALLF